MSAPIRVLDTVTPPTPLAKLVDEWLADVRAKGSSPRTIDAYRFPVERIFLPYCAENSITSPEQITPDLLNRLNQRMLDGWSSSGKPLSRASIRSYVRQINVLLRWIHAEKNMGSGTTAKLPKRQKVVVAILERAEIAKLENAADSERDGLIVRLLADTGMRLGELLKLRTTDLITTPAGWQLRIQGKGSKERLVPLQPPLAKRIRRYIDGKRPKDANTDRLFLTARRSQTTGTYVPISKRAVELMLKALGEQAGFDGKRVYPHLFRHSLATHLLRKGVSPFKVVELLGHASLAVLYDSYSHVIAGDARGDLDKFLAED